MPADAFRPSNVYKPKAPKTPAELAAEKAAADEAWMHSDERTKTMRENEMWGVGLFLVGSAIFAGILWCTQTQVSGSLRAPELSSDEAAAVRAEARARVTAAIGRSYADDEEGTDAASPNAAVDARATGVDYDETDADGRRQS